MLALTEHGIVIVQDSGSCVRQNVYFASVGQRRSRTADRDYPRPAEQAVEDVAGLFRLGLGGFRSGRLGRLVRRLEYEIMAANPQTVARAQASRMTHAQGSIFDAKTAQVDYIIDAAQTVSQSYGGLYAADGGCSRQSP